MLNDYWSLLIVSLFCCCCCFYVTAGEEYRHREKWQLQDDGLRLRHRKNGRRTEKTKLSDGLDHERLELELIRHQTCKGYGRKGTWIRKIQFPAYEGLYKRRGRRRRPAASVEPEGELKLTSVEPDGSTCYKIDGNVTVRRKVRGNLQVYIMMKNNMKKRSTPFPCTGYNENTGCGGHGSCLYCDSCQVAEQAIKARAAIYKNGEPLPCDSEPLSQGNHPNMSLHFCLPNKKQLIHLLGIPENLFNEIIGGGKHSTGRSQRRITIYAVIYIFETNINRRLAITYRLEQRYRRRHGLESTDFLRKNKWNKLPFYHMVGVRNQGFIGCHKIFGNLVIKAAPRG